MAGRKPRRKSAKAAKTGKSRKVLPEDENGETGAGVVTLARDEGSAIDDGASGQPATGESSGFEDTGETDWPERDNIRDGLIGHVRKRFGIDRDVAERAIDDILRIA